MAVGSVVKRLGPSPVAGAHIGALRDERLGEFLLVRRRSQVQSGVTGVHVVMDRDKEIGLAIVAARSDLNRAAGQTRRGVQSSPAQTAPFRLGGSGRHSVGGPRLTKRSSDTPDGPEC